MWRTYGTYPQAYQPPSVTSALISQQIQHEPQPGRINTSSKTLTSQILYQCWKHPTNMQISDTRYVFVWLNLTLYRTLNYKISINIFCNSLSFPFSLLPLFLRIKWILSLGKKTIFLLSTNHLIFVWKSYFNDKNMNSCCNFHLQTLQDYWI